MTRWGWLCGLVVGCASAPGGPVGLPGVLAEDAVCLSIESGPTPTVVAMGLDSQKVIPVRELPSGLDVSGVDSLGFEGRHLYWCNQRLAVSRVDLVSGEMESATLPCEAVADIDGGVLVMPSDGGWLRWYDTWAAVRADQPEIIRVNYHASRLGRQGGDILTAWHSTGELERFDADSGQFKGNVKLEDYDGWVHGLGGVGERIFVLHPGRVGVTEFDQYGVAEFDRAGNSVFSYALEAGQTYEGLVCVPPGRLEALSEDLAAAKAE